MKRPKPTKDENQKAIPKGGGVSSSFELDQHLFFWFTQVLDRRDRHLAAALKPYSLRVPEWRALASLHSRHALSMSELADLTSIERTTLSRTVDRMVRKGWVVRLSDTSDMRVTRLAPTATGEKLFTRIWPAVQRLNEAAVAGLPAPVTELLKWALQQMRRSLDESLSAPVTKRRAA
jgi:MarR family multiple antibiotic resistance transcriptional regulator